MSGPRLHREDRARRPAPPRPANLPLSPPASCPPRLHRQWGQWPAAAPRGPTELRPQPKPGLRGFVLRNRAWAAQPEWPAMSRRCRRPPSLRVHSPDPLRPGHRPGGRIPWRRRNGSSRSHLRPELTGTGDALVNSSTTARPPAVSPAAALSTTSPPGTFMAVATTGMSSTRRVRTAASSAATCQRSSAPTAQPTRHGDPKGSTVPSAPTAATGPSRSPTSSPAGRSGAAPRCPASLRTEPSLRDLPLPLLFAALTGRSGHGLARMGRIREPTRSASTGGFRWWGAGRAAPGRPRRRDGRPRSRPAPPR